MALRHKNMYWMHVSSDLAERHPLFGLKGGLLVLALLLAVAPILDWFFWAPRVVISPESAAAYPLLSNFSTLNNVAIGAIALSSWALLGMLLARRKAFQPAFVVLALVQAVYPLIVICTVLTLLRHYGYSVMASDLWGHWAQKGFLVIAIAMLALSAYVLQSKRVNLTLRGRVPTNDLLSLKLEHKKKKASNPLGPLQA